VSLGVLLLLAAGGAAYLSLVDRQSAIALSLVEVDGMLPVPVYALLGVLGAILLAVALVKRLGKPTAAVAGDGPRRSTAGRATSASGW
jgi:hypothetical protein